MTDQLTLYNRALGHCQETKLATITENRPSRHVLDLHYTDVLKDMIEGGFWHFAMRSVSITYDPDISPAFGYTKAFNTPEDWVKTYQVSASDRFTPPLEDWIHESNLFWCDQETIYLRYVSNSDDGYGYDLDRWTERFTKAFALELAARIAPSLPGSNADVERLEEKALTARSDALSFEAMTQPPRRPPMGNWNRARFFGRGRNSEDRG